ncbi:MAG TPA: hypothetical protein H9835_09160 [Candidatus Agathobaculum merdigallinarum]|nr:hypothetical protein [Candidatus Agathobaculum merdigallinarum]
MKKRVLAAVLCALGILWMVGCSANSDAPTTEQGDVPVDTENQGQTAEQTTDLSAVVELVGKADEDTADLLGGGEENWTSDQQTFIGRIYQTELYGDPVMVYSSCSARENRGRGLGLDLGRRARGNGRDAPDMAGAHLFVYRRRNAG